MDDIPAGEAKPPVTVTGSVGRPVRYPNLPQHCHVGWLNWIEWRGRRLLYYPWPTARSVLPSGHPIRRRAARAAFAAAEAVIAAARSHAAAGRAAAPPSLQGITVELAEHSATLDHALDHDERGTWYCRTCSAPAGEQEPVATLHVTRIHREVDGHCAVCVDIDGPEAWPCRVMESASAELTATDQPSRETPA